MAPSGQATFRQEALNEITPGKNQGAERIADSRPAESPAVDEKKGMAGEKAKDAEPSSIVSRPPATAKSGTAPAPVLAPAPAAAPPATPPTAPKAASKEMEEIFMEGGLAKRRKLEAAPKEAEEAFQEGGQAKRQKLEKSRDQVRAAGRASYARPTPVFTITVREVGPSAESVRALLKRIGAENIVEETRRGGKVITAVVARETLEQLAEHLKAIGEVRPPAFAALPEGATVAIKIEIVMGAP